MLTEDGLPNYCDLTCRYAKFPDKLCDGAKTCRTFVALYCLKKNRIVCKNKICGDYIRRKK